MVVELVVEPWSNFGGRMVVELACQNEANGGRMVVELVGVDRGKSSTTKVRPPVRPPTLKKLKTANENTKSTLNRSSTTSSTTNRVGRVVCLKRVSGWFSVDFSWAVSKTAKNHFFRNSIPWQCHKQGGR